MRYSKFFILTFIFIFSFLFSQEKKDTIGNFVSYECQITQTRQKLDNREFASTPATHLRVNNSQFTYTTLQFGKRKNKIFVYLKILDDNVCIKKGKVLDVIFRTGEVLTLKNEYPLNCEGFFSRQLKKKEIDKLLKNLIGQIKVYTFYKNYELYVDEMQNYEINHSLNCLKQYKIKTK